MQFDGLSPEDLKTKLKAGDAVRKTKFVVTAGTLIDTISMCPSCGEDKNLLIKYSKSGASGHFKLLCVSCRHNWYWRSSGQLASPVYNSQLTGAILYTGNRYSNIARYANKDTRSLVLCHSLLVIFCHDLSIAIMNVFITLE